MVDIENQVFDTVKTALIAVFDGIFVSSETVASPSTFPCATIVEMDNSTHLATLNSSLSENHSDLMYQIDVYSNLSSGRKSQAKSIMAAIDSEMMALGFTRSGNAPSFTSDEYYRKIARYRGIAGASIDGTVIQIYRR
jgi:hypothetical protein